MKNLIGLIVVTTMLSACGGGGGGGAHVPDTTPHTYTAVVAALTNTNQPHDVTIHQVCDFGLPDVRDESSNLVLQDPSINGGDGCGPDSNYTLTVENTGVLEIYLVQSIDGVDQPQVTVEPGTTFTFSRGF